jgi:hypothetical protein
MLILMVPFTAGLNTSIRSPARGAASSQTVIFWPNRTGCASSDRYEVRINNIWLPVPATALRDPLGSPNPTGHAVVWWTRVSNETVILCFAPGNEL